MSVYSTLYNHEDITKQNPIHQPFSADFEVTFDVDVADEQFGYGGTVNHCYPIIITVRLQAIWNDSGSLSLSDQCRVRLENWFFDKLTRGDAFSRKTDEYLLAAADQQDREREAPYDAYDEKFDR